MSRKSRVSTMIIAVLGFVTALSACGPGGGGGRTSSRPRQPSSSESRSVETAQRSVKTEQRSEQMKDEMIRRVNGIVENIGSAEERLKASEQTVCEEQDALEETRQNARTAHLGGQMTDFRTWQRIGREKRDNIRNTLKKAENTVAEVRRGAESELRRVNWVSDGDKSKHLAQINRRLNELGSWASTFQRSATALAKHSSWLDANE